MSAKENLLAAIRDYAAAAQHIGSARQVIEAANELASQVQDLPDPVSQGAGSVPAQNQGSSGQRGESNGQPTIVVNVGTGQAPRFPDKSAVVARLKGN